MTLGSYHVHIAQLASFVPVQPLAKLTVKPEDFPFLTQIRGDDDERLQDYANARPGAEFAVLFGRRRVGKSSLIYEWCREKPHLYFFAARLPGQVAEAGLGEETIHLFTPDDVASVNA